MDQNEAVKKNKTTKGKIFFCGFFVGLISSIIYVYSGGDVWLYIPEWAWILFWPGFIAGEYTFNFLYHYGMERLTLIIGLLSVAVYYGILARVIYYIGATLNKKITEPQS